MAASSSYILVVGIAVVDKLLVVWEKNETVAGLDSQEKPKGADETSDPKWDKDEPDFY